MALAAPNSAKFAEKPSSICAAEALGNEPPVPQDNAIAKEAPAAVLDTNASLDWLLFRDPGMQALAAALRCGEVRWLACEAMRQELAHMLHHERLSRWQADAQAALAIFDQLALVLPAPPAQVPQALRCSDPDDQVFIDLALAQGARWLLTKDRALLKLARKAALRGLQICRPGDWQPLSASIGC